MSPQGSIDVHAHFLPDRSRTACQRLGRPRPDGLPAWPDWTVGQALTTMDQLGVELAILSISSPGVHFGDDRAATVLARGVNEDGAALAARHPDRFGFFASLPLPDVDSALEEIDYALDQLGAGGVVLLSHYHRTYLFDPRFRPVLDELDRRGAVISTRAITGLILAGALEQYPGLRIIVPHGGGALPSLADRIHTLGQLTAHRRGADPVDAMASWSGAAMHCTSSNASPSLTHPTTHRNVPMTTAHSEDLGRWRGLPAGTVCDCLNRFQAMHAAIRPVVGGTLLGRAWTARSMPGENNTLLQAIGTAPAGSILVVDAGGFTDRAVWGEVRTMEAIQAGVIGLVVDGAVRDVEAIRQRDFTVFARGICAAGPNKGWNGDVGGQIQCAGVVVNPGDLVVADTDGVVVVPRDREEQVLVDAHKRQQEDADLIAQATQSHR